MKAVVTVVGRDRVGIISEVSTLLAEESVNIMDVSQTILGTNFTMMMHVELEDEKKFHLLMDRFREKEAHFHLKIKMYNEEIFNAMHSL